MKSKLLTAGVAFSFLLLVNAGNGAEPGKAADDTWTDPAKALAEDRDFAVQGEYGQTTTGAEWGAQVVALGGGKFDAYLLEGGLPGLGWDKSKRRLHLSGAWNESAEEVRLAGADGRYTAVIAGSALTIDQGGKTIAKLSRVERQSPTVGAKPPAGAVVLFDGTSANEWKNGRVENGLLPNSDITTKRTFGSYRLHLEFRTPYKPFARGQGRGNSGVYHQGRFETQVLDSFGLEGKMNETGGIYTIADPILNMCLPPLTWQTYDVDFTAAKFDDVGQLVANARMTVRLNGVVVQNDVELPKTTTASPLNSITPEKGPLYIQHHGNPVYYRNIWIVEKK